jgi:hypothetical protein
MIRRPWVLPFYLLLFACLTALPACKKKKPAEPDNPNPAPGAGPGPMPGGAPPSSATSDYLLFAHVNVKAIRDSQLFADIKQAVTKAGGTDVWNKTEGDAVKEMGFKPSDLNSVTVFVPDFPGQAEPKALAIFTSSTAIDKANASELKGQKPDARGFYKAKGNDGLIHFPDDKTVVFLSKDLADKYLAGYAKNRSGWPMTPELAKAYGGHTLYVAVNITKVPKQAIPAGDNPQTQALLSAQALTVTGDLKGKNISLGAVARFPDAATAGKAKETVQQFLGMAAGFVGQAMNSPDLASMSAVKPVVQEAQRTLKDAKVEASGADVTLSATYKADFDINKIAAEAVPQIQASANRMKAQNNLRQVALALHNYMDTYGGQLPIHAVGAKGMPLKNDKDKPLLSWRVAILPYIEQVELYKQFKLDEPWDSENNKKLIEKMPAIYAPVTKPGKPGYTHLQMVVGPGAMHAGMKILSITDGTSNTIAVAEAAEPVIWTKPDDIMVGKEMPKDFKKKFGGQFPGGFNVALWDGSVRFVPDSVSEKTLWAAITPTGGEILGSDWDGGPPTRPGGPGAVPPKRPGGPGGFVPPRPPGPPGRPAPPGGFKK